MESTTLSEGASFGEIATATEQTDAPATPETQTPEAVAATDGGTTEPEVPAAFKETEQPSGEDKPDLSIDSDLEKHPILKAKWEAFVAQKEKGIDKWMTEQSAKVKEATDFQEQYTPLVEFYNEFGDEKTVDQAIAKLVRSLEQTYPGRKFAIGQQQTEEPAEGADPQSKYGLEYASDDKVVDAVLKVLDTKLGELKVDLEPVKKHFSTQAEREALTGKASAALPQLKQQFEIASDPWVTAEKVQEAMARFPGLEAQDAFQAHFAIEIARRYASYATRGGPAPKNMATGTSGAKTVTDLKPGADFFEIMQAESTLG